MNEIARKAPASKGNATAIGLDEALRTLRAHRAMLEGMGVIHAGIFGSVARGEAGPTSDLDILVEVDRTKIRSIYDYCEVRLAISDIFSGRADVVERKSLRSSMEPRILAEVVGAF